MTRHEKLHTSRRLIHCTDTDLVTAATNCYAACFGQGGLLNTQPDSGNGIFSRNSRIRVADISDGTSNTLAIGERCTIQVIFTPTAPGIRTASLFIAGNISGGTQAIDLSGTGNATGPTPTIQAIVDSWGYPEPARSTAVARPPGHAKAGAVFTGAVVILTIALALPGLGTSEARLDPN